MKGVKHVVKVGESAVAVVADTWWQANSALEALPITWDEGPNAKASSASIAEFLKSGLDAEQAFVGNESGNAKEAIAKAAKKVEAVYSYPYQHHATMEPMNTTVLYTADRCEAWVPTQVAEAALASVSEASGLPIAKCDVHKMPLGGGFGRRTTHDFVQQAVAIAKQMPGTPVKLVWSREEDMTHGRYHPVTMAKMVGAFDANNNLTALHMRISGQSILSFVNPQALQNGKDPFVFQGLNPGGTEGVFGYTIPNLLVDHAMRNPHIPPHFWRGVNNNHNAIYLECFMDELAHAAGQDPLEFRRKLLGNHPKHLAVLNAVAERIGWGKPAAQGVYRGLAQHMGYGSYVAAAAEVSVTGNKVKLHRIVGATNCGNAVNPAQIDRQVAGSFVYGLSALFLGECTVKDGRIEQTNFHDYNVMRIADMPKVESIIMPSGDFWGGVGEPTIFVAAPAVLNAIFAATGKRLRTFPLKNQGIAFA
jgi:isoquinoline 1-oxidoreductase subunit beta